MALHPLFIGYASSPLRLHCICDLADLSIQWPSMAVWRRPCLAHKRRWVGRRCCFPPLFTGYASPPSCLIPLRHD
jgi:hypothetical protein